ncbi:MAG: tryptophan 2,3-dioxygenase family protein [Bacteroidota bacterium]
MQNEEKYTTIHYQNYLGLDELLKTQVLRSEQIGKPAHEEMLFIITHQVYELWFKQIIHELNSVIDLFSKKQVNERNLGAAIARLDRVERILQLLVDQIGVMESMTPLDFLDFRAYLFPASGFQSFQFRAIESLLGLPEQQRMTYHNKKYSSVFPEEQQKQLAQIYEKGTLFDWVNKWLERTPFLNLEDFNFIKKYKKAVKTMLQKETAAIDNSEYLTDKEKSKRKEMLGSTDSYFKAILSKKHYDDLIKEGKKRLSYDATIAALFINLYRDEPILQLPFQLLTNLMDIDDLMTNWRTRHAQMVLRLLGNKIGTGGSSGHEYLNETARRHQVFVDFHTISTLLIPRSELPNLPPKIKQKLGYYFPNYTTSETKS